jgi:hypothetical protein
MTSLFFFLFNLEHVFFVIVYQKLMLIILIISCLSHSHLPFFIGLQLMLTLQEDEFSQNHRLAYRLDQVHAIMTEADS